MKSSFIVVFYSIFISIYTLANFYIYIRGYQALSINPQYRLTYSFIFWIMASAYLISRFLEHSQLYFVHDLLYWIGSFWFAVMLYSFLIILLTEITRLVNLPFHFLPETGSIAYQKLKYGLLSGSIILISLLIVFGYINARTPRVKELNLAIAKNAGNYKELRIAMVSDIHMGVLFGKNRMKKMTRDINNLHPDIIFLAGDILDEVQKPIFRNNTGEPLKNLNAKLGVYGITGNHEYIGGITKAINYIQSLGITMIRDTVIKIDGSFYLAGREDKDISRFTNKNRKELKDILDSVDKSMPIILMDHQPFNLKQAEENGVDLQLSGHTHHGQFWPLNLITSKIYELSWGYKKIGNTHIYVSNGYGFWGPPIRIGNRPEIVLITLYFSRKS